MQKSSESIPHSSGVGKYADVNWDELGFSLTPTDYMYMAQCKEGLNFAQGTLTPFRNIELSPCSTVLQYGQGLFEGLKAYRTADDRILLFRPEENALRMKKGADRMCMQAPSVEQFVDAVKQTVLANKRWIPPPGKGALYLRPMLMGSSSHLGVQAATEYIFLVFASPVGSYHKGEATLNLLVENKFHRAIPSGTGDVKAVVNYSPTVKPLAQAKAKGFSDVLFLDSVTGKYIEEVSACNIFMLKGDVISTPATNGNILPGITRKSIIELAKNSGYKAEERAIPVDDVFDADEVFCTGTGVVVSPVSSITYQDKRYEYKTGKDTVSQQLHAALTGIQTGSIEDKMGWTVEIQS
ncbi:hypothetical protein SLE2022_145510 [Rubroshorea leprosula]